MGLSYFRERGFSDATIEKFQLGYCPSAGDDFSKAALKEGFQEEFLIRTGLTIKRDNGTYYDRFTGRVMFPIHGITGRVMAFGGRTLRSDKKTAKYLNSPESEIYHKSNVLYGLYFAKKAIAQEDCCILVEGYTDVISMHQSGVENVVASSGTSLTENQIKLISRFTKNVTVIYDGDAAGIKASLRGIDMILKEGLNVRVVLLPEPEDPDSFARSHTVSELREYIGGHEEDFISFKTRLLMADAKNDPIRRAALIGDIVESISVIPDAITRNVYVRECATVMDIDESVLLEEIRKRRRESVFSREEKEFFRRREELERKSGPDAQPGRRETKVTGGSGPEELEHELLTYLLKYGCKEVEFGCGDTAYTASVATAIIEELQGDNIAFSNPVYNTIYQEYKKIYNENPLRSAEEFPMNRLTAYPDTEVCNAVVDILMAGETLKPSRIWERNEIVVRTEEETLSEAVPRTVTLYKTKIIEQMIERLTAELKGIGFDEAGEIMRQIGVLNDMRRQICEKYSRILL